MSLSHLGGNMGDLKYSFLDANRGYLSDMVVLRPWCGGELFLFDGNADGDVG